MVSLEQKVAFLSAPESYPFGVRTVKTKQTHMSWIFLTETHAWKLRKPARTDYLDFSTLELRRLDCLREIRLNRRLAPDVYLGLTPLTLNRDEKLQLDGKGEVVDWLVCMHRLPSDRMLDWLIAHDAESEEDAIKLASVLVDFYKTARRVRIPEKQYRERLAEDLEAAKTELGRREYGLPSLIVDAVVQRELLFLRRHYKLFDERVRGGKIIEGHGDLRPEHICFVEARPEIIDCLQFNRRLRVLDAASELVFLALECERLGAPKFGGWVIGRYIEESGDMPAARLLAFYRTYHAVIRAKIAAWHLKDKSITDRAVWIAKAERYLQMVLEHPRMRIARISIHPEDRREILPICPAS